jgi:hypothetical protein
MSNIPNAFVPHANESLGAEEGQADEDGRGLAASLEAQASAARDIIQNVPTKAWTIGAIVAGVAASVVLGAFVTNRKKAPRRAPQAARRRAAKSRPATTRRAKAA